MSSWHKDLGRPPWRPLDNRERRAMWASKYYARYEPAEHPMKGDDKEESTMTPPVHVLSEERGTDDPNANGYLDWIRPACSCGWRGSKWHSYHNFQWSEAAREGSNHIRAARFESDR